MDKLRFFFSEALLGLALAFLALVAAKAVAGLQKQAAVVRGILYAAILALAIVGARGLATGIAAGVRAMASLSDMNNSNLPAAYQNALRAVELRPGDATNWRILSAAKFRMGQFESVLKDQPSFEALNGSSPDEEMTMRFAYCHYFLGQYDQVFPLTASLIQGNRFFGAPYVLEGMTYLAQKRFAKARQRFLDVLQMFPNQEAAVEGLAHTHYLMGDTANALQVLNQTQNFPFSPEARQHFEALKAFYAQ